MNFLFNKVIHKYSYFKLLLLLLIWMPGVAFSHGGVENVGNQCKMRIGPFSMLFTGYQPKVSNQEFCDDIPEPGNTFVVLDHVDKELRGMPTDYRVLKDVKDLGVDAKLEDLGTQEEIEAATIYYMKPKLYKTGTMVVNRDFELGRFIGLVTVTDTNNNKVYTSVFPFSVGYGTGGFSLGIKGMGYTLFLVLFVLVLLVAYFHKKKEAAK